MKLRVLLAAALGMLVFAGTASAHPTGGAFGTSFSVRWFDTDDGKLRDLMQVQQTGAEKTAAKCKRGMAAEFACQNVDLLAHLPLASIGGGEAGNDMWGWQDPATGREYALVGKTNGTAFVDVTKPKKPVYLGQLPTQSTTGGIFWRDIKVYKNHVFVVSENTNHGMQVFDLTRLRNVTNVPATFTADTVYTRVSNTHNLDINEETGFAYLVGTSTCGNGSENGGLHMVDILNPKNPRFAGCAIVPPATPNNNYVHDTQCVIYRGPHARFQGREICFGSNENAVVIYDVTNKSNPVVISQTTYPTAVYTHQGWLTGDQKWFVFNDEGDENGFGQGPTVTRQTSYVVNVENLVSTGQVMASPNNTTSIDHNLYMPGNGFVYESNYTSGLRIFTEQSVPTGRLQEVAWFDVYPENDNPTFEGGTWSNYSWFKRGVVGVSTIDRGLFLLKPQLGQAAGPEGVEAETE